MVDETEDCLTQLPVVAEQPAGERAIKYLKRNLCVFLSPLQSAQQ